MDMLPNVPPIFIKPLQDQKIYLSNYTAAQIYRLPEIFDHNNDTVNVLFNDDAPEFIEYNYIKNAIVYNFY